MKIRKNFRSLPIPNFVTTAFLSSIQTPAFVTQRRAELEVYLTAMFNIPTVRLCIEALEILGIHQSIVPIPRARLQKSAFEKPLLTLSDAERENIAGMIAFASRDWPQSLSPIYIALIKQLELPITVADKLLQQKVSM